MSARQRSPLRGRNVWERVNGQLCRETVFPTLNDRYYLTFATQATQGVRKGAWAVPGKVETIPQKHFLIW